MKVVSPKFPGMEGLGKSFTLHEEWYALYKFAKDLHVILVQETEGHERRRLPAPALSGHLGQDAGQGPRLLHFDGP